MKAKIEFKVKNEEEFKLLKNSSKLDGETWTLIRENKLKKLKTEINNLNLLLSDAMESEWDMEEIYRNFRDGNGFSYGSNNPNKKMADWVAKRYKLNKKDLDNE